LPDFIWSRRFGLTAVFGPRLKGRSFVESGYFF
jgi:hypothetical protein